MTLLNAESQRKVYMRPPVVQSTNRLIQNIPGVSRTAPTTTSSSSSNMAQLQQNTLSDQQAVQKTPYEAYKAALQNKIKQGQQFTDQYVQVKNAAFAPKQKKYAYPTKVFKQSPNQPTGKAYGGKALHGGWGNHKNGQIPANALAQIAPGHYMRADAASGFSRMNAAFRAQFGRNISITDSYRSLANQVLLKRQKPGLAATPGTSNHGWGLALDLGGGINRFGTLEHNWMVQNASRFGFAPLSGNLGAKEPWHWEYRG